MCASCAEAGRTLDAILLPFLFAALAEIGGGTMQLAAQLGRDWQRPGAVAGGITVAALIAAAAAGTGGLLLRSTMPFRAANLLLGVALLLVAGGNLFRIKPADHGRDWRRLGPFAGSLVPFVVVSLGDGAALGTLAFVARGASPWLVAPAIAAGTLAIDVPALLAGPVPIARLPFRPVRIAIAIGLGLLGIMLALDALRLV